MDLRRRYTLDTLNLDRLKAASLGDQGLANELASIFLEDAAEQLRALNSAVAEQNVRQVAEIAHRLKGSCGNVGAEQLYALFAALEGSADRIVQSDFSSQIDAIESEFASVRRELSEATELPT